MEKRPEQDPDQEMAHPDWFREPSVREHWIACGLFVVFGLFFGLLFWTLAGWWFRWVILALGVFSVWHGLRHGLDARRARSR